MLACCLLLLRRCLWHELAASVCSTLWRHFPACSQCGRPALSLGDQLGRPTLPSSFGSPCRGHSFGKSNYASQLAQIIIKRMGLVYPEFGNKDKWGISQVGIQCSGTVKDSKLRCTHVYVIITDGSRVAITAFNVQTEEGER